MSYRQVLRVVDYVCQAKTNVKLYWWSPCIAEKLNCISGAHRCRDDHFSWISQNTVLGLWPCETTPLSPSLFQYRRCLLGYSKRATAVNCSCVVIFNRIIYMLAACRVHICYDVHICLPSMFSRSVVLPWQYRVDLVVLKRVSNVDIAVQRDWDNRQCVCHHQSPWLNVYNVFVTGVTMAQHWQCVCHLQSSWLNVDNVFVTVCPPGSALTRTKFWNDTLDNIKHWLKYQVIVCFHGYQHWPIIDQYCPAGPGMLVIETTLSKWVKVTLK